ncbi:T9SS type A sorting domain-containing protein [Cryomorpha ignava]|uniref:T9SS type A sorting domain-containing protein n=1 Tax=Cryomorpha ignava TaxID=101383 RepID=A0A7K3WVK6_9FLAO|nr:T9SS type A sorting domain-containing protein [Cryomorpha ignava]NEN25707.1 T9SS type A sorting domain-containing protein [Cryomorpha ignava]
MENILRKPILLLLTLVLSIQCYGQISFQKTFWNPDTITNHRGFSVVQLSDEGYAIAGASGGFGILKRTDKYGNELWTNYYSVQEQDDLAFSNIQKTMDGNLIVTGVVNFGFSDSRYYDAYLAKIDTLGNVLWQKNYGGNYRQWTRSVKETTDNGFILGGYNEINGSASSISFYLVRTNVLGDTLWTRSYDIGYQQSGEAVAQTTDSGFVIVGNSHFTSGVALVIKTDSNGDTLWTKYLTDISTSGAYDVTNANNGNIIISGFSQLNINGCSQPFLMEIDLNGNMIWYALYQDGPCGWSYAVTKTNDNGYALFGMDNNSDGYLIKTDSVGSQQWYRKFDENSFVSGYDIRQTSDNGFIMTGTTGNTNINVLLIKTNDSGDVVSTSEIESKQGIVIFPNPTNDNITIQIPEYFQVDYLRVYNNLGQQLLQKEIKDQHRINLNTSVLPSGIYYIKIGSLMTKKIIKY